MQFDNQKTRNVADVVAKILAGESAKQEPKMLEEELKGNQHKIDANKNNKIDAHDFKLLRAKKEVKKEEVEQIDELSNETLKSYLKKTKEVESGGGGRQGSGSSYENQSIGKRDAVRRLEARSGKIGKYGVVPKVPGYNKEEVEQKEENFMTFSEMMAAYKEHGLAVIAEEPTEEQFNKEIQDQIASATGKKKQPGVSTPSTQGVKSMPEEIEVIDANLVNGVEEVTIDERTLTKPEAKKKEEVVKSMKKGVEGFKARYGDRAKSVMYATATRIDKEKA